MSVYTLTDQGFVVTPLDEPRALRTISMFISGNFSGNVTTLESGMLGFVRQVILQAAESGGHLHLWGGTGLTSAVLRGMYASGVNHAELTLKGRHQFESALQYTTSGFHGWLTVAFWVDPAVRGERA